jgi:hypothetical protein
VLIGISITYTVVGGESLHAFAGGVSHEGSHTLGVWVYIILFGGLQLFLSMVRLTFELLTLLSVWAEVQVASAACGCALGFAPASVGAAAWSQLMHCAAHIITSHGSTDE